MNKPDRIFKNDPKVFLKSVIYPEQFKQDEYKILFHIVNVCFTLLGLKRLMKVVEMYIPNYNQKTLESVLEKHNKDSDSLFRYECFSHIRDILTDEDLYYTRSGKNRTVTIPEYKFLLHRITRNLYQSPGCKSVMVNKFFHTMKDDFHKNSAKTLDTHKLAHILQVLHKHKYLHIIYNSKNQRVVQIGPANPYYQLTKVPNLDNAELQDVSTKTDREINQLRSELQLRTELNVERNATIQNLQDQLGQALADLEKSHRLIEQYEKYLVENYTVNPQIEEVKYPHNGEHYIDTEDLIHSGRFFLN